MDKKWILAELLKHGCAIGEMGKEVNAFAEAIAQAHEQETAAKEADNDALALLNGKIIAERDRLQAQVAVMTIILEEMDGIVLGRERPTLGTHIRIKDALSAAPKVVWSGKVQPDYFYDAPHNPVLRVKDFCGKWLPEMEYKTYEALLLAHEQGQECSVKAGCSRNPEQGQDSEQEAEPRQPSSDTEEMTQEE